VQGDAGLQVDDAHGELDEAQPQRVELRDALARKSHQCTSRVGLRPGMVMLRRIEIG
jgi:hypothetical protein